MEIVRKKYIFIFLLLIELTSLFLMYKSNQNKKIILDNVSLKENLEKKDMFAIMIEQDDGTYAESNESEWPTDRVFNVDESGCIDTNGNKLSNVLSYDSTTQVATVDTDNTTFCYLYFSFATSLCDPTAESGADCLFHKSDPDVLWDSGLQDDGLRYIGTNPNNYICFGTTDMATCTSDPSTYMYRIIGIFFDSDDNRYLKLIKKEALNTKWAWHTDEFDDYQWSSTTSKKNLNGSYFLTNYVDFPYLEETTWTDKIASWTYTLVNTDYTQSTGLNYGLNVVSTVYLHELQRSMTGVTCWHSSVSTPCSTGTWGSTSTKIGLMYVSDYLLSLGPSSLSYKSGSNNATLKTGWMHLSNNDSNPPSSTEYTIAREGIDSYGQNNAWGITSTGKLASTTVHTSHSMRPVFYLTSDTPITDGYGTFDEPFILG